MEYPTDATRNPPNKPAQNGAGTAIRTYSIVAQAVVTGLEARASPLAPPSRLAALEDCYFYSTTTNPQYEYVVVPMALGAPVQHYSRRVLTLAARWLSFIPSMPSSFSPVYMPLPEDLLLLAIRIEPV